MNFRYPSGDWCVIQRSTRDTRSAGEIVQANLSEKLANALAQEMNEDSAGHWNYWVIPQNKFFQGE